MKTAISTGFADSGSVIGRSIQTSVVGQWQLAQDDNRPKRQTQTIPIISPIDAIPFDGLEVSVPAGFKAEGRRLRPSEKSEWKPQRASVPQGCGTPCSCQTALGATTRLRYRLEPPLTWLRCSCSPC